MADYIDEFIDLVLEAYPEFRSVGCNRRNSLRYSVKVAYRTMRKYGRAR